MSAANRLTKEELRSEVKEYLISLREERIQRSIEVKERLRQLRLARIERMHDVKTSLAVMESMRLKAQLEDGREDLRERVQQLRADARSMLKEYSETRKKGFSNSDMETNEIDLAPAIKRKDQKTVELKLVRTAHVPANDLIASDVSARSVEPKPSQPLMTTEDSEVQDEREPYQHILSRVVTGLCGTESGRDKNEASSKKDNSLIGKIRRLANGEFRSSYRTPEKKVEEQLPVVQAVTATDSEPVVIAVKTPRKSSPVKLEKNGLLHIEGIGPSVLKRLERIGICTLQDLASTDVRELERSFGEYAKLTDLGEWISQAKLKLRAEG